RNLLFNLIKCLQYFQRELHVPNVESLSMGQLEEIYGGFVVPQPRREPRQRHRQKWQTSIPNQAPMPMELEQLTQRIKSVAMLGQKRPPVGNPNDDSIQAKQIKMDLR
ncbi:hypothetical protein KR009_008865, partial [Drosophila setifemur]